MESFLDELAHAAGKDPYEFRRALLVNHPRHKRVLELAAEKAGWGKPPADGRGRGLAVHESFGSFVAQVAEVSVSDEGDIQVHRVVCAIDCGPFVNPDTIRAQMEGGIVFGLTAALYGEITFEKGRVKQQNFNRLSHAAHEGNAVVETHIVPSTESMGGVGETAVPPIAPAVTNALFRPDGEAYPAIADHRRGECGKVEQTRGPPLNGWRRSKRTSPQWGASPEAQRLGMPQAVGPYPEPFRDEILTLGIDLNRERKEEREVKIRIWGSRGSIATPGPTTLRYGGNSTCLEIRPSTGEVIIVDAGSGLRNLGAALIREKETAPIRFFFTHSHWDHLMGFPFFRPAYSERFSIGLCSGPHAEDTVLKFLNHQMKPPFFPVSFGSLKAKIRVSVRSAARRIRGLPLSWAEGQPGAAQSPRRRLWVQIHGAGQEFRVPP